MVELDERRWGTRRGAPGLRGLGWFEEEFVDGRAPGDYLLAGAADAATNFPAVQYLLVRGPLGLFLEARGDERGRPLLDAAQHLQDAQLPTGGRLVVLDCQFGTRRWQWTGADAAAGSFGVEGALDWLDSARM